jgi:hypothetical protein
MTALRSARSRDLAAVTLGLDVVRLAAHHHVTGHEDAARTGKQDDSANTARRPMR